MTRYYHSSTHFLRSISEHTSFILLPALLTFLMLLSSSCEEDASTIGRGLLPDTDFVNIISTDTIGVRSFTMYADTVRSSKPSRSWLGQIYDPYFGITTAELVTQLRLAAEWEGKYFEVDSVKMFLKFFTVTGDVSKPHYLRMSEIANQIYKDSAYYSNQTVHLTGFVVPDIELPPLKADTINDIVLDVPISFGERITSDTSMLFHSSLVPDFRSYFKGLYLQLISPEDPVFVSLSVAPPGAYSSYANYILIYLSDGFDNVSTYPLILDAVSQNAAYNRYVHDYDAGDPLKKLTSINDTTYFDTLSYVQTFNGVYTRLVLPGLKEVKNIPGMTNISVNKARLILPVQYDGPLYKPSSLPNQIFMRYATSSGPKYIVPDYSISSAFFDGTPDTTAHVYNINIPAFVQKYLQDNTNEIKPELDLFLLPGSSNNAILKANSSSTPVKFEFTYTRF